MARYLNPTTSQYVSYTGSSTQSAALNAATTDVELISTTDCYIAIGANPTAAVTTAGSHFLPAFTPRGFAAFSGQKIAAIQSTAAGTLAITELT